MRTLDFSDHRRELDDNRYVYAVVSRRSRGLSIGINLNPDKVCNFDCPYCQVDRRVPGGDRPVDIGRLERELDHLLGIVASGDLWSVPPFDTAAPALRRVNDIAFAGDGEPTSCRVFADAVRIAGERRAAWGLDGVALYLLTNATLFQRPAVWEGLERLGRLGGRIWAKLDAGTPEWFRIVDGTPLPFDRVLDNLLLAARRWPLTLQCMFMAWDGAPPPDSEVDAWVGRIGHILDSGGLIAEVQVYTLARAPADSRATPLTTDALRAIGDKARAPGVPVTVIPASGAQG